MRRLSRRGTAAFRRGFASTFALDVLARGLSAIATVLFVRSLEVDSFAYVVLFLNVGQFAGSALTGGIRMRYTRVEAERVSRRESEATGFALAWAASMALIVAAAALCATAIALLGSGGSGGGDLTFVGLAAAYTAGHASVELAMYHYQAHLAFVRAGLVNIFRGVSTFAVAVAAALGLLGSGPVTAACLAATIVAVAAVPCVALVRQTVHARPLGAARGDFIRESGWLTCYFMTSAGFSYATIFVVAALLDDTAVASYGAALRYASIVFGPFPALMTVLRVRSAQSDIVDSPQLQLTMLVGWVKRAALPVTGGMAAIAALAPFAIPLVDGGRYPDSVPVFQLMLIAALFSYATMPAPNLLMSQRRFKLLAGVYAIALVVHLAALVIAGELAGVVAVAAASVTVRSLDAVTVTVLAMQVRPPTPPGPVADQAARGP